jgi:hypothetical protein
MRQNNRNLATISDKISRLELEKPIEKPVEKPIIEIKHEISEESHESVETLKQRLDDLNVQYEVQKNIEADFNRYNKGQKPNADEQAMIDAANIKVSKLVRDIRDLTIKLNNAIADERVRNSPKETLKLELEKPIGFEEVKSQNDKFTLVSSDDLEEIDAKIEKLLEERKSIDLEINKLTNGGTKDPKDF